MSSIRDALELWEMVKDARSRRQAVVLATLVAVRGSAYRRPGAKMVMRQDGRMLGTLSGGCLEGDLFLHAQTVMETNTPSLHHYDLTEDDMWGLGIGCKGAVDIWLEPVSEATPFWQAFEQAITGDEPVLWGAELPAGRRFLVCSRFHAGEVPTWANPAVTGTGPETGVKEGIWWDLMRPPERVVIAGAGHDAEPVARLARQAGFEVIVLDPRAHVNNADRFPHATHRVQSPAEVDPKTLSGAYWVIMNHHQRRDEDALRLAEKASPQFVGVLGPRRRTEEMLEKTRVKAANWPLHAPVGLDLGAETPEEVAISIVGELMAHRRGTGGGPLNGRERIHE